MEHFDDHMLFYFKNDLFIKWITAPDHENIAYWENWMKEHPDQADSLLEAKKLALHLQEAENPFKLEQLSKSIWETINARIATPKKIIPFFNFRYRAFVYRAAAVITALTILGSSVYYLVNINARINTTHPLLGRIEKNSLKRMNGSVHNQVVYLVDGTSVTLEKGSSIRHSVFLQKDKREVYLDGNAFFEVAKDSRRPFYVYTHDIVMRVLGTSFKVITNPQNGSITVMVKTGKVSVYKSGKRGEGEFILTHNQGIVYTAQTKSIIYTRDTPGMEADTKPDANAVNFNFEDMPVIRIFETLQRAYGIKINFDDHTFSRCMVTTSLSDETFEEKLKIICTAVDSKYRIVNNQVFITGKGCQ